jgi:hypothetical protein
MAQTTKRCHWVPQSYLKAFAEKSTGKIWRLGKDGGEPELKRLDKVAVKFHLYSPMGTDGRRDDALEKNFADLESYFGDPVWKELCNGYPDLSWKPLRMMVALLVATTWLRTPTQFEDWQRIHNQMRDFYSGLPQPPEEVLMNGRRVEIDTSSWPAYRDASEEDMKAAWNGWLGQSSEIAKLFLDMRWAVLVSNEGKFITSDNPVMVGDPTRPFRGLKDPGILVTFPISPTRLLLMDRRHSEPDSNFYESKGHEGSNTLVWRNAINHMFSPRHPNEVCAEIVADGEAKGFL